jgi:hypothetical protein
MNELVLADGCVLLGRRLVPCCSQVIVDVVVVLWRYTDIAVGWLSVVISVVSVLYVFRLH